MAGLREGVNAVYPNREEFDVLFPRKVLLATDGSGDAALAATAAVALTTKTGSELFLVGSVEECAEKLLYLLRNPEEGAELALLGKDVVEERFLLTRLISDELSLYADLLGVAT